MNNNLDQNNKVFSLSTDFKKEPNTSQILLKL